MSKLFAALLIMLVFPT